MAFDGVRRPVELYYPAVGEEYVDRLLGASMVKQQPEVRRHPVSSDGLVDDQGAFSLHAMALDHTVSAVGWRLVEPDGVRMLPEALADNGVSGPDVGRLQREGRLRTASREVTLAEVSVPRPGQVVAFVMDTRRCAAAVQLAEGADLLVCESTFLSDESDLADDYGHLTARQAAQIALDAGVRRLVLTHFSQRHPDVGDYLREAAAVFPDVHAARDLDRVAVPRRQR
jgi:ribonuclease Z